jgi:DNA-binding GntR family transcriptional regulator
LQKVEQAHARASADGFASARRQFYRSLLVLSGSRELQRLFPHVQMPIVYAQYRIPILPTIRVRDYDAIAQAVLGGEDQAADAAAVAHVRNVRREVLRIIGQSNREE